MGRCYMSQKFSSRARAVNDGIHSRTYAYEPFSEMFITEAEVNTSSRHIYTFSDGSVENIALYQGWRRQDNCGAMPKGSRGTSMYKSPYPVLPQQVGRKYQPILTKNGWMVYLAKAMQEAKN